MLQLLTAEYGTFPLFTAIGVGPLVSAFIAALWTSAEQRIFAFQSHGSPTLPIAGLLAGTLLYAVVVNLAAWYRARCARRRAEPPTVIIGG